MNIVYDLLPWEQMFLGSSAGLLATAIASVVGLVRRGRIGPLRAVLLFVFAIGVALPWLTLPRFGLRLQRASQTNIADTTENISDLDLVPRRYALPAASLTAGIERTLARLGWRIEERDADSYHVAVPVRSTPFTDDLRLLISEEDGQTVINARSQARVGRSDFGVNRRHIVQFFAVLDEELEDG
jgi:uncharacterized protein (DUF1499 family)